MASENLSADKVKIVQVYENHQPVKALKDVQFSEQAGDLTGIGEIITDNLSVAERIVGPLKYLFYRNINN